MIGRMAQLWEQGQVGFWLTAAAYAFLVITALRLSIIDIRSHRLPNRILFPGYAVAAILLLAAAAAGHDGPTAVRTLAGAGLLYTAYFVLRFCYPPDIGRGDVKLAFLLGLYLGHAGWQHLIWGSAAAFVLGGLFGLTLIGLRRATRKTMLPFGPFMLVGAILTLGMTPV